MGAAILAAAVTLAAAPPEEAKSQEIGYISPEIPKVTFPELKGEWQEGLVPDTLDLAERARLSINALTESADPEAGYEIWWHVLLNRKPPVLVHDFHDLNVQYKFQEALPLLRYVSGSDQNLEVDQAWPENLLRMQGEDGLIYMPFEGRPWAGFHADWLEQKGLKETQLASTVAQGGWLGNFALYYLLSGDEFWKERLQKLVDGVARLMIYKDDYCYFPLMAVNPDTEVPRDREVVDPDCTREASGAAAGWIIQGLSQAYLAIGYQPALDLARKLAIYMTRHSGCYDSEGRFRGVPHTHLHTRPISGLLEFAMASQDQDFIEYSKNSYEYARDSSGSATVGFFPSTPGAGAQYSAKTVQQVARYGVEGCTIADMAALAIKLRPRRGRGLLGRRRPLSEEPVRRDAVVEGRLRRPAPARGSLRDLEPPRVRVLRPHRGTEHRLRHEPGVSQRLRGASADLAGSARFRSPVPHALLHGQPRPGHLVRLAAPAPPPGRGPEGQSAPQPGVAVGGRPELYPLRRTGRREGQTADPPPGSDSRLDRT